MGLVQSSHNRNDDEPEIIQLPFHSDVETTTYLSPDTICTIASFIINENTIFNFSYCCKHFYSAIHYNENMNEFWVERLMKYFSFNRWNRSLLLTQDCDTLLQQKLQEYVLEVNRMRYDKQEEYEGSLPPVSYFFRNCINQLKLFSGKTTTAVIIAGSSLQTSTQSLNELIMKSDSNHEIVTVQSELHPLAYELYQLLNRAVVVRINNVPFLLVKLERWSFKYQFRNHTINHAIYCDNDQDASGTYVWNMTFPNNEKHKNIIYWMRSNASAQMIKRSQDRTTFSETDQVIEWFHSLN
jgi:hypothetical protein